MNKGWLKLYRSLLEDPIWTGSTPEQKVVFITLLLMANFEEAEWEWKSESYSLKPGQFITSLKSLEEKCGKNISTQNVRTALARFEKYGFLTNESTKQNRLITIVNWGFYQQNARFLTKQLTNDKQTPHNVLTTSKNVKKEKNIRNTSFFQKLHVNEFRLDLSKGEA